ncbi:MAG: MFS transporter [Gemmatimonadota bacterium]
MARPRVHYGWVIVVAGAMTVFSCLGLARFAYGMLLPLMGKSLALRYDEMGFIGTGNFAGYLAAVGMAPYLMRRIGASRAVAAGLALDACTMALIGSANGFRPILGLYFLTGVGSGLANVPMMVLVSHWFARETRGRAAGLMLVGNGVAIVFAGLLIPALGGVFGPDGWRAGWRILGGLSAAVAAAAWILLRDHPADLGLAPIGGWPAGVPPPPGAAPHAPAGRGTVAHLGVLYLIFGLTYMVYGTFIVTTMVAERGMAVATAGRFWSWVGIIGSVSGPLFGALSDRIGRKGGFMTVFAVQTACYGLAGLALGTWSVYASIVLYGMSAWAIPTIMAAAVGDYMGTAKAATAFSVITFFFAAGQTLGPGIAGVLARSSGTFNGSYLLAAAATALGILAAAALPRPGEAPAGKAP